MNPEEKNQDTTAQTAPDQGSPTQETTPPPADPPKEKNQPAGSSKSRSRPVKVYLTVLFCVALLLLLISFVMQQRNHMALQNLNEAIEGSQEAATLQLENQRLQYDLEETQGEKERLEKQLEETEKQLEALEWLRQIESAVRTSYTDAVDLVKEFEESGLTENLPTTSPVEGGQSPADAYRAIYAMLF